MSGQKSDLSEVFYINGKLCDKKGREVTSGVTEDTVLHCTGKVTDQAAAIKKAKAAMKP